MDSIKASEELKEKTYQNIIWKKNSNKQLKNPMIVFICFVLVVIGAFYYQKSKVIDEVEYSFITIDVNPSMELVLNKDDLVISATAYNEEAKTILKDISYVHQPYQEVLQALMNNDMYQHYLTDHANIQISIYSDNVEKCNELEKNIDSFMETTCMSDHYESICIDEDIHHQAGECHISSGRYILIKNIIDCDSSYTIEELKEKSISELKDIYKNITNQDFSSESWHHHEEHH